MYLDEISSSDNCDANLDFIRYEFFFADGVVGWEALMYDYSILLWRCRLLRNPDELSGEGFPTQYTLMFLNSI